MLMSTVMPYAADVNISKNEEFKPLLGNGGLGRYNTTFPFDYGVPGYSILYTTTENRTSANLPSKWCL
jgi:hypothetical protein